MKLKKYAKLFAITIAVTVFGGFFQFFRIIALVSCLILLGICILDKLLMFLGHGTGLQIPGLLFYAMTLGEQIDYFERIDRMKFGCLLGILGMVALIVFLFFGWGSAWWYAPLGIIISLLTILLK